MFIVLCCLVAEVIKFAKIKKEYDRYYNALYRWACEKHSKTLDIDEFEEVLNNYNGSPIKREYFSKK